MRIDESAPVVGRAEIEGAAEPQVVWDVIAGIDEWPRWNPDIREASLDTASSRASFGSA
jgi:polyketide cyclase/dehydrase/lipid transport protein